jgi:hypothetical protein
MLDSAMRVAQVILRSGQEECMNLYQTHTKFNLVHSTIEEAFCLVLTCKAWRTKSKNGQKMKNQPSLVLSVWLFSCGLTVLRTTMNLFRVSNQNGAPRDRAIEVMIQPKNVRRIEKGLARAALT